MNEILNEYLFNIEGADYEYNGKKYHQSVHGKSYTRFNVAKKQSEMPIVEINTIKNYISEFL